MIFYEDGMKSKKKILFLCASITKNQSGIKFLNPEGSVPYFNYVKALEYYEFNI